MSDLLFDTCFLIDLEREMRRGSGAAHAFLQQHTNDHAWISWTVAGEFAEGFSDIQNEACIAMLSRFDVLDMNESTAGHYAQTASILRKSRQLIGANDLWIAAAALAFDFTLVSRNASDFSRVRGLKLMSY